MRRDSNLYNLKV